jgi:Flp pilus assembly protein TadD
MACLVAGLAVWIRSPGPIAAAVPPAAPVSDSASAVQPEARAGTHDSVASSGTAKAPTTAVDVLRLGNAAYEAGDFATALSRYEEVLKRDASDAEALNNAGQVLVRLQRHQDAVELLERASAQEPHRWDFRFNLARALSAAGDDARAIEHYREAARLNPGNAATFFNLGLVLHRSSDEKGAVEAYRQAVAVAPDEPAFQLALGNSFDRLGQTPEAVAAYRRYLDLVGDDGPDAAAVQARLDRLR